MKVLSLLEKVAVAVLPLFLAGMTYLLIDVVTLKATVNNQLLNEQIMRQALLDRLDRIERKLDRLHAR